MTSAPATREPRVRQPGPSQPGPPARPGRRRVTRGPATEPPEAVRRRPWPPPEQGQVAQQHDRSAARPPTRPPAWRGEDARTPMARITSRPSSRRRAEAPASAPGHGPLAGGSHGGRARGDPPAARPPLARRALGPPHGLGGRRRPQGRDSASAALGPASGRRLDGSRDRTDPGALGRARASGQVRAAARRCASRRDRGRAPRGRRVRLRRGESHGRSLEDCRGVPPQPSGDEHARPDGDDRDVQYRAAQRSSPRRGGAGRPGGGFAPVLGCGHTAPVKPRAHVTQSNS